jgi:hypothetical protein
MPQMEIAVIGVESCSADSLAKRPDRSGHLEPPMPARTQRLTALLVAVIDELHLVLAPVNVGDRNSNPTHLTHPPSSEDKWGEL